MYFFKVIFLIPILWFSISKIDKEGFYSNYFKNLKTLDKKNYNLLEKKTVDIQKELLAQSSDNQNQSLAFLFYINLKLDYKNFIALNGNKEIRPKNYSILHFLINFWAIWVNAPPCFSII
jgi:hypothetical protein